MIKKDLNDTKYNYALLPFTRPIKLYIESKIQHITTAEYRHRNCTTKIDYACNADEFKEPSQI